MTYSNETICMASYMRTTAIGMYSKGIWNLFLSDNDEHEHKAARRCDVSTAIIQVSDFL